jgi:polyhydroxybutyrate depolymerase
MLRFSAFILFLLGAFQSAASACGPAEPCRFGPNVEYRVAPPPGWDGKTAIGAFVFVHGHRASAAEMINYSELVEAVHAMGFMLVAPQGLGDSWSTPGSPSDGKRDEVAFMARLLDDLTSRFPIDRKRIVGSGFSQGSSVIWEIACHGDGRFSAFVPVAGVWWTPMPKDCQAPPRPMLHIHGIADRTMPLTGRTLGGRWKQGDVMQAYATMKRVNACPESASSQEKRGVLSCEISSNCGSGKQLAFCLHDGDHHTNPSWFMEVRDWIDAVLKAGG